MRVVLQRVKEASVSIENILKDQIGKGYLLLLGIEEEDTQEEIEWLAKKIVGMRIFSDEQGKMNKDIRDVEGEVLIISQFTLHANCKKGNRPSFIRAARPEQAIPLYEGFIKRIEVLLGKAVGTGVFGADMQVALINDGPVTIILDSKQRDL